MFSRLPETSRVPMVDNSYFDNNIVNNNIFINNEKKEERICFENMKSKKFVMKSIVNIVLISFLWILLSAWIVFAIPNPASIYCKEVNGTIEINETPLGEQGLCAINGNKYDEWEFLEGKIGQNYSWCIKNGYEIETLCDGSRRFLLAERFVYFKMEAREI